MKIKGLLILAVFFAGSIFACFDTYLFLSERPMVYPKGKLAVEGFGEYSVNEVGAPSGDGFLFNTNAYYGITDKLSVNLGAGSSEKERGDFAYDEINFGATYNLMNSANSGYSLDAIAECANNFGEKETAFELSAPNLFHGRGLTIVAHPVMEIVAGDKTDWGFGAHCGVFKSLNKMAVFGIGAEYMSAQSGPVFGDRLVEGEAAASLFFGAMLGRNLYIQNELAKGLANSRDFGFAMTLKFLVDLDR